MKIEKPKYDVYLVILNITSWTGQCSDATHIYGNLIFSKDKNVDIYNIEEYSVRCLGENFQLRQPLTLEISQKLDKKDGHKTYERAFRLYDELKNDENFYDLLHTDRFDTFEELENFAINIYKELNINCPFISLYNGEKYDFNYNGESGKTKILNNE